MENRQPAARQPSTEQPAAMEPSTSALTAAAARAAHLTVDQEPLIFADPLAARLLGERAAELISYHTMHVTHPVLIGARVQATCRSRYAEDALARAAAAGVRQYVILGAGLDSFAYRGRSGSGSGSGSGGPAAGLCVFEVDHPASQEFKLTALRRAGIPVPGNVRFVPADLAAGALPGALTGALTGALPGSLTGSPAGSLIAALAAAGFDASEPAVVAWLGVTMYLSPAEVAETLTALGGLAPGSEVIADYLLTEGERDEAGATFATLVAPLSAEQGEPWRSCFTPAKIARLARAAGFGAVSSVRQRDTVPAALWQRTDSLRPAELAVLFHGTVSQR